MVHPQRTSDEKRPGRGRQRINPREFATTAPRTPETAANYVLHHGLRQDGGGDQRGDSSFMPGFFYCVTGFSGRTPVVRRVARPRSVLGKCSMKPRAMESVRMIQIEDEVVASVFVHQIGDGETHGSTSSRPDDSGGLIPPRLPAIVEQAVSQSGTMYRTFSILCPETGRKFSLTASIIYNPVYRQSSFEG